MALLHNAAEARVLGSLIEKDITTPEYYPLSLNALINACNQKQNREPVMQLDEDIVRLALRGLEDAGLATRSHGASRESRVPKFEHRLQEVFNFTRAETAIMCVLLLRGAQTPGELRGRTERMFEFVELEDVVSTLQKLMQREPPLVAVLPRQPGTKESRYAHLMLGEAAAQASAPPSSTAAPGEADRLAIIEDELAALRTELEQLRKELAEVREKS